MNRRCPVCTAFRAIRAPAQRRHKIVQEFRPLKSDGTYSFRKGTKVCGGCGWGRKPSGVMFSRQANPPSQYGKPFREEKPCDD